MKPKSLIIGAGAGLSLWLDGAPLAAKETLLLDLTSGTHTLTIAVDKAQRKEGLRVELDEAPGSAGRFQIVSGK